MASNSLGQGAPSAKIYQFPIGGRAALGARRNGEASPPADHGSSPAIETICSGSWYHQEAIDESKSKWDR